MVMAYGPQGDLALLDLDRSPVDLSKQGVGGRTESDGGRALSTDIDGYLYADPHPGNYRFLPDGRVAFLDFGCVKIMPKELIAGMKRYMRAAMDQDWPEFDKACVEVLGYTKEDKEEWELYRSYTLELLMPITTHQVWECSPEVARETVQFLVRGTRDLVWGEEREKTVPHIPKPIHMPPDFTFVNRLQWGLASVMGGIRTKAKFREVTEPWIRDDVWDVPK